MMIAAAILAGMGLVWLLGVNIMTYRAFADDKARAVADQQRIPEHRLLNLASMGGSVGAVLAQRHFRHKTRKEPFASDLRHIILSQAVILLVCAAALLFLAGPAAAAGMACPNPSHHDGDAIRCGGGGRSDRLFGIDAPEMPGACRPGRRCTPGDPFAARDYLASLTAGRNVTCEQMDIDSYGRRVVRCAADGIDLSCAMVAAGQAVERYGRLDCGTARPPPQTQRLYQDDLQNTEPAAANEPPQRRIYRDDLIDDAPPRTEPPTERTKLPYVPPEVKSPWPMLLAIVGWLLAANIAAYQAFAIDKGRAQSGGLRQRRIPENALLALAAVGGSIGAVAAQRRLHHKTHKQPFATRLLMILGVHIGVLIGCVILLI